MMYIVKQKPEQQLLAEIAKVKSEPEWRNAKSTEAVRACFDKLPKEVLRKNILKDQHYLCAYCMKRIENDFHTTVEHYKPLSKHWSEALNYDNMICVCDGGRDVELAVGERRLLCCDAYKEDAELFINPFMQSHIRQIKYLTNGKIYAENSRFKEDINERLKLNGVFNEDGSLKCDTSTGLVKGRRAAYEKSEVILKTLSRRQKLTSSAVKRKIEEILLKEKRQEFAGVTVFFLEKAYRRLVAQKK